MVTGDKEFDGWLTFVTEQGPMVDAEVIRTFFKYCESAYRWGYEKGFEEGYQKGCVDTELGKDDNE